MTQPPAARGTTILVVEDDDATRDQIARLLRLQGYATLEAADGAAALDTLRRGGVAAVISDVTMPGSDGFELVAMVSAQEQLRGFPSLDARGPALRSAVAVNSALAAQAPDGSPVTVVAGSTQPPRGR